MGDTWALTCIEDRYLHADANSTSEERRCGPGGNVCADPAARGELEAGCALLHGLSDTPSLLRLHTAWSDGLGINPMTTFQGECTSKLPPQDALRGAAGQASETALTNALGFSGAGTLLSASFPACVSVVCLGESSTFGSGYYGDAETDSFYLQKLLEHDNLQAEVISTRLPLLQHR